MLGRSTLLFPQLEHMVGQWTAAARAAQAQPPPAAQPQPPRRRPRFQRVIGIDEDDDAVVLADNQTCRICFTGGGFLRACDQCAGHAHSCLPCSHYNFPPPEGQPFLCGACRTSRELPADVERFACVICMDERPLDERVRLADCEHDPMCTACMFQYFRQETATCPLCRSECRTLLHMSSGRDQTLPALPVWETIPDSDDDAADAANAGNDAADDANDDEPASCYVCDSRAERGELALCDGSPNAIHVLAQCDTCARWVHAHPPCSRTCFPPSETQGFLCDDCSDQPAAAEGQEMFECGVCLSAQPMTHAVSVRGCAHEAPMCSRCAFRWYQSPGATCPVCRNDGRVLVHQPSQREWRLAALP